MAFYFIVFIVLVSFRLSGCTVISSNYAANEHQSHSSSYAFASSFVQFGSNPEEKGEFFEGDIEFDDPNVNADTVKNLVRSPARLWKKGEIYYEIDKNFSASKKRFIEKALHNIMKYSCVKFLRRTHKQTPYLKYREAANGKSCSANVGFTGKEVAYVNLGKNCFVLGTIQHETLHVLGFWHEQSRPDRDRYVDIHYDRILKGNEANFKKRSTKEATTLNLPYDFGSIMHYSRFAFSSNPKSPTITPKKTMKNVQGDRIGQRINISKMDIAKLNTLYHCPDRYYKGRDFIHVKAVQSRPVKIQN